MAVTMAARVCSPPSCSGVVVNESRAASSANRLGGYDRTACGPPSTSGQSVSSAQSRSFLGNKSRELRGGACWPGRKSMAVRKRLSPLAMSPSDADVPVQARDPVDVGDVSHSRLESEGYGYQDNKPMGFGEQPFTEQVLGYPLDELMGGGSGESVAAVAVALRYRPKLIWWAESPEAEHKVLNQGINALIVLVCGASALAKVLTVDSDVWTGWSLAEILRRVPADNWAAYQHMLDTNPVLAKMTISGIVYALGDWSAQTVEGRPLLEFDRMRMLRSGLVGLCLHGSLSHFYYHFCEWLFPFEGPWVVPVKVAFDQTIWSAIWNSIYFTVLAALRLEKPSTIASELKNSFWPMLTAGWKLWPFAHLITYGVVPVEHRLLWVDMVELVWVTILSTISNGHAGDTAKVAPVPELLAVAEGEAEIQKSLDEAARLEATERVMVAAAVGDNLDLLSVAFKAETCEEQEFACPLPVDSK